MFCACWLLCARPCTVRTLAMHHRDQQSHAHLFERDASMFASADSGDDWKGLCANGQAQSPIDYPIDGMPVHASAACQARLIMQAL